jgi:cytochrome c553
VRKLVLALVVGSLVIIAAPPTFAGPFEDKISPCITCHGVKGQSENPETPSLGGQPENYLLTQMFTFREKLRKSELMNEMAKDLTDDDLRTFSVALAKLPSPPPSTEPADPARMERAKALAVQGKCNICHQANFAGQDQVPKISAQREDYLLKSLRDYKSGARLGYDPAMIEVMRTITEDNITDLAHYLSRTP